MRNRERGLPLNRSASVPAGFRLAHTQSRQGRWRSCLFPVRGFKARTWVGRNLARKAAALLQRLTLFATLGSLFAVEPSFEQAFQNPPASARPTVWWRFMDDFVTREGITADLDSIQRLGLSGAVVSFCSSRTKLSNPQPGLPFVPILSKEWWGLMGFQLKEASARNLDLWFQACPGYATSGGPWITPELSMQKLVWSETACEGGKSFEAVLPVPTVDKKWNYYRDIAVLAVPVSGNNEAIRPDQVVDLTQRMETSGRVQWEPKAGAWKIVRLGHTTTGVPVHPVTKTGYGLECDKLSREAARVQFDNYFKKILDQRPARSEGARKDRAVL